jgi:hypothetical protein
VNFDKVYMNFTNTEITFNFQGLISNTNYSIFHFITVDNPSINAKHSDVSYINLVTRDFLQIDLWAERLVDNALVWMAVLMALVYLS